VGLRLDREAVALADPLEEVGGRVVQAAQVKHVVLRLERPVPRRQRLLMHRGVAQRQARVIQEVDAGRHQEELVSWRHGWWC
jgi:hypothetical protein